MEFYSILSLFKALSDENRLRIFVLLSEKGSMCVGELVDRMQVPQPSVSRALSGLKTAHLVTFRRQRNRIHYSVNYDHPAMRDLLSLTGGRTEFPTQLSLTGKTAENAPEKVREETEKPAPAREDQELDERDDDFLL